MDCTIGLTCGLIWFCLYRFWKEKRPVETSHYYFNAETGLVLFSLLLVYALERLEKHVDDITHYPEEWQQNYERYCALPAGTGRNTSSSFFCLFVLLSSPHSPFLLYLNSFSLFLLKFSPCFLPLLIPSFFFLLPSSSSGLHRMKNSSAFEKTALLLGVNLGLILRHLIGVSDLNEGIQHHSPLQKVLRLLLGLGVFTYLNTGVKLFIGHFLLGKQMPKTDPFLLFRSFQLPSLFDFLLLLPFLSSLSLTSHAP
jgi:hypothetical protein